MFRPAHGWKPGWHRCRRCTPLCCPPGWMMCWNWTNYGHLLRNKDQKRWVWLALCRRTRQVVAYWIGDRSEAGALHLWRRLPRDYVRCASFSDRWQPYRYIFDYQRHRMVGKEAGETNHVERWFNTLRQRLARFTRKTLAFSKRDDLYDGLLRMFIYDYNLSCIN